MINPVDVDYGAFSPPYYHPTSCIRLLLAEYIVRKVWNSEIYALNLAKIVYYPRTCDFYRSSLAEFLDSLIYCLRTYTTSEGIRLQLLAENLMTNSYHVTRRTVCEN